MGVRTTTKSSKVGPEDVGQGKPQPQELELDLPQAESLEVINMAGQKVKLAPYWKDQKLVIVFLRRFDCQTCFSYIILFAHLRPILKANSTRIIFVTCHETLSEVQVFLTSFAYWLKTLNKEQDDLDYSVHADPPPTQTKDDTLGVSREASKASKDRTGSGDATRGDGKAGAAKVGVGTKLGALPGELFLDPDRNAYRVFGIGNELATYQKLALFIKIKYFLRTGRINKVKKTSPKNRLKTYTESSRAVWREWFLRAGRRERRSKNRAVYRQSPGIVVMDHGKLLYRYVCHDQLNPVPSGSDPNLEAALACRREDISNLDQAVQKGLADFVDVVRDERPDKLKVASNDLVLEKVLGSGKESEVYKASWMGIPVAVKYFRTIPVHSHGRGDKGAPLVEEAEAESIQSFSNEVSMLLSLRHPNVITMMGFGVQSPNFFLITEFMPKGSLFHVLEDMRAPLGPDLKRQVLMDVASGMAYLHGCKPQVIHQDLKSLNLLVAEDFSVKVSDFGIARDKERNWLKEILGSETTAFDDDPHATTTGFRSGTGEGNQTQQQLLMMGFPALPKKASQGGTLQWMAPEHLNGRDAPTTTKSDVYAFGVILWEVATRKKPWKSVPFKKIVESVVRGERPPVPAGKWDFGFRELVDCCWAQDAAIRPEFVKIKKMLAKVVVPD
ncbi:hypothetical protein HDU96_008039 [Phlyctochytrium bullatum]|nr:hypothetical protein HDU96_008039 [Phlyctochytrium bullatum]